MRKYHYTKPLPTIKETKVKLSAKRVRSDATILNLHDKIDSLKVDRGVLERTIRRAERSLDKTYSESLERLRDRYQDAIGLIDEAVDALNGAIDSENRKADKIRDKIEELIKERNTTDTKIRAHLHKIEQRKMALEERAFQQAVRSVRKAMNI